MSIRQQEVLLLELTADRVEELDHRVVRLEVLAGPPVLMLRPLPIHLPTRPTLAPHAMARLAHSHHTLHPLHVPYYYGLTRHALTVIKLHLTSSDQIVKCARAQREVLTQGQSVIVTGIHGERVQCGTRLFAITGKVSAAQFRVAYTLSQRSARAVKKEDRSRRPLGREVRSHRPRKARVQLSCTLASIALTPPILPYMNLPLVCQLHE